MQIDKKGNTYQNYEKMKKVWGGTRLSDFVRRWKNKAGDFLFKKHDR